MDKQGLIVIGIILAAWVGWSVHRQKERAEWLAAHPEAAATDSSTPAAVGTPTTATPSTTTLAEAGTPPAAPAAPVRPAGPVAPHLDGIAFATPQSDLTLTTRGAAVETLTFKSILDTTYVAVVTPGVDPNRKRVPLEVLRPRAEVEGKVASFAVEPLDPQHPEYAELARGDWTHEELPGQGHRFTLDLPDGVRLTKTYTLPAPAAEDATPRYDFDLDVTVENTTDHPVDFAYRLLSSAGMVDDSGDRRNLGQQAVIAHRQDGKTKLETLAASSAKRTDGPDKDIQGEIPFYGLETKYFAAVVIPDEGVPLVAAKAQGLLEAAAGQVPTDQDVHDGMAHQALAWGETSRTTLAPGASRTDGYTIYVGPKKKEILEADGSRYKKAGLDGLVDFGWFEPMARLLLWVLGGFYAVIKNWGVSIILLTFLVRGLLLPISIWSQKNMLRMQKIGPEINKLKEKYTRKDGSMSPEAQRQFSAEQMELFRKHGVNPIGCVGPIFLQFPVFIGLWNALNYSFELRGQPFVGWIHDLSVPDVLFRLPFTLPLMHTDALSLLPLLMTFSYWLQQYIQPTPTDPKAAEQQKMMKYITPLFGLMLYTAPSGLMMYFLTSSFWTLAEQKFVRQRLLKAEGITGGFVAPTM
jgi:YidC/Oxa1 family membrane protein insertase